MARSGSIGTHPLSPTREVEGINTAPTVSAEQEIAQLRVEVQRLSQRLQEEQETRDERPAGGTDSSRSTDGGGLMKIEYDQNALPHPATATIMQERYKEGSIRPSTDFDYLPQPSTTAAQLEDDFVRWGYCIVGDAMGRAEVDAVVSRMVDQAAAERAARVAHLSHGGNAQLIFNCLPKGQLFRDVIEFSGQQVRRGPLIEALLGKILGRGWYLGTSHGSIVHEGGGHPEHAPGSGLRAP